MNWLRSCTSSLYVAALAAAGLLMTIPAQDATAQRAESFAATHFAQLNGQNETQPVDDDAIGIAVMRLDFASRTLSYRLSVTRISGITMAHFHRAPSGEDGPILHTINGLTDANRTVSGVWQMSEGALDSLLDGLIYVNVHTAANARGHIRGQVFAIPNALAPEMNVDQEVGGDTIAWRNGVGNAALWIDEASRVAAYYVQWSDLSGPATAAHFHAGPIFQSGGVVKNLAIQMGDLEASGVWEMSQQEFDALKAGGIYVNVHTAANPNGEIRGQVFVADFFTSFISAANEVPEPHDDSSDAEGTGFIAVARTPLGAAVGGGNFIVSGATEPLGAAHIHAEPTGIIFQELDSDTSSTYWTFAVDISLPEIRLTTEDTAAIFRAGGMYVNFHTSIFPAGEARGQLIPAATNLSAGISAIPFTNVVTGAESMIAWIDRPSGTARLRAADRFAGREGTVVLYSSRGDEVTRLKMHDGRAIIPLDGLGAGVYFAQLLIDGRQVGTCSIPVVR